MKSLFPVPTHIVYKYIVLYTSKTKSLLLEYSWKCSGITTYSYVGEPQFILVQFIGVLDVKTAQIQSQRDSKH